MECNKLKSVKNIPQWESLKHYHVVSWVRLQQVTRTIVAWMLQALNSTRLSWTFRISIHTRNSREFRAWNNQWIWNITTRSTLVRVIRNETYSSGVGASNIVFQLVSLNLVDLSHFQLLNDECIPAELNFGHSQ